MRHETVTIHGHGITVWSLNTVIVGSGAAGLNAADRLHAFGVDDIALVTEGMDNGTSRNTGSDKQTYYKLTLAGGEPDSVRDMAETLFSGGAMHGDLALVEAALSARCFHRLVEVGVPFPHNGYGEYVGYKTDHDPRQRATSAGPLTSRLMTVCLQEQVEARGIRIFDRHQVVAILTGPDCMRCRGLVALDLDRLDDPDGRYVLFNCTNVIYATGGPAGMYSSSVYPRSQAGAHGIAFEAGVRGRNLTESQFGIASTGFRWNLSGTFQQVLPRYVSTDADGGDEREFLGGVFPDARSQLDAVFLKGYQWPFDSRRVMGHGSSLVDILVYRETVLSGRRAWLDYTRNPVELMKGGAPDFSLLGDEGRAYLGASGAMFGTPFERLAHMNPPAVDLYRDNGIDLARERLEIAVCNQHNNGGLAADAWWESDVARFFPVGEVNGSHGVYRPGGSALNAGQVGGLRAAQRIAACCREEPPTANELLAMCGDAVDTIIGMGEGFLAGAGAGITVDEARRAIGRRMDRCGGIIRDESGLEEGLAEARGQLDVNGTGLRLRSVEELPGAFRVRDLLISQIVYLSAMLDAVRAGYPSRGSALVHHTDGVLPADGLPDTFRCIPPSGGRTEQVQLVSYGDGSVATAWEPVRPIPDDEGWFEDVWRDFRDGTVFRKRGVISAKLT